MERNERLAAYIAERIASSPLEAAYVRRIVRNLKANGTPVTHVHDGEQRIPVRTERDVLYQAFDLDELVLITSTGAAVWLVMGQFPDMVSDWNISLDAAIEPATAWAYDKEGA